MPLKRLGSESELSAAVCFLLGPGSGFINGDALHMDGGGRFASSLNYQALPDQALNEFQEFGGFHRAHTPDALKD